MPPPFQDIDLEEFHRLLTRFPFERRITTVHLHNVAHIGWADWRGYETLRAMWYTHTLQRGYSDLAQHLTIDPTGTLWTGRDWNRPPCSCPNQNGDAQRGPFMITLIGDFSPNGDRFADGTSQYAPAAEVVARLQRKFELPPETLCLHRDLDRTKTCPGESVDPAALIKTVTDRHGALAAESGAAGSQETTPPPFGEEVEAWYQFITISSQNRHLRNEPADVPRSIVAPLPTDAAAAQEKRP